MPPLPQIDRPVRESSPASLQPWPTELRWLTLVATLASLWSLTGTNQPDVWAFELVPGIIALAITVWVGRRYFRFSGLTYSIIGVSFVFIAIGARYTYAEVPLFHHLQQRFDWARNHADRAGHFLQGLTVALMAREGLVRATTLQRGTAISMFAIAFALAFSAMHEIVEWWVVMFFYPDSGPEWLGMQGDPWDAQWDMFMALIGACVAAFVLNGPQDRSIQLLQTKWRSEMGPVER